jgi:hypothetical protein
MDYIFPKRCQAKGPATQELTPYDRVRKPLVKERYIGFKKNIYILKNGFWNIGSISKKFLSKLVSLTKS